MPTNSRSGCERCQYLDGGILLRYIDSLRHVWVATVQEVAADTGVAVRQAHRALTRLEKLGRAERFTGEGSTGRGGCPVTLWRLVDKQDVAP